MTNTTNSNKNFIDFSKNNYHKHWSYSNFFRYLYTAEQIIKHNGQTIIELGASNSPIKNILKRNFNYTFKSFDRSDITLDLDKTVKVVDITKGLNVLDESVDVVILEEVLEHIDISKHDFVLKEINRVLKINGILLFSTPTPNKSYEEKCWPNDHDFEYDYNSITSLLNKYFLIEQDMVWSHNIKEYNKLVSTDSLSSNVYTKLRGKMPDGFIQAIISLLAKGDTGRQIILTAIKKNKI